MPTLTSLESRIKHIESRNSKVETDKAWETSLTRRISITILTYVFVGFYLSLIGTPSPWINAFVPVLGFILSTLSLELIKNYWVKNK